MHLFSEAIPQMGGIHGRGIAALLRGVRLDDLSVLVRETVQNSWDARLFNDRPVEVSFSSWSLSLDAVSHLREHLGGNLPSVGALDTLRETLAKDSISVISVRDVNCHGLDGGTVGNEAKQGAENRYIGFLLNVGASDKSAGDGGAFGYGRSITYRISKCMLILIYSRTRNIEDAIESRFIGSMLSNEFTTNGIGHTGRHWWGRIDSDSCRPVVGHEADELASLFGVEPYSEDETGTTILIVDPVLSDEISTVMDFMADALVWNMWPKMIPDSNGKVPMVFSVRCGTTDVELADPLQTFPLSHFCDSLELVRSVMTGRRRTEILDGLGSIGHAIGSQRPKMDIGVLALKRYPVPAAGRGWTSIRDSETGDMYSACPIEGNPHHVAVMRTPELIVDYFEYRSSPDDNLGWSGVFRCHDEMDSYFSAAEPPSHDSWNKKGLPKGTRAFTAVSVALQRIRKFSNEFCDTLVPRAPAAEGGVKALAKALSKAFDTDPEDLGGGVAGGGRGGVAGGGARTRKVELLVGAPRMKSLGGGERKVTLSVSARLGKIQPNRIKVRMTAGVSEAEQAEPQLDPSLVSLLSVKSVRSATLWTGSMGQAEVELSVAPSAFPLTVEVHCREQYALQFEARGFLD